MTIGCSGGLDSNLSSFPLEFSGYWFLHTVIAFSFETAWFIDLCENWIDQLHMVTLDLSLSISSLYHLLCFPSNVWIAFAM